MRKVGQSRALMRTQTCGRRQTTRTMTRTKWLAGTASGLASKRRILGTPSRTSLMMARTSPCPSLSTTASVALALHVSTTWSGSLALMLSQCLQRRRRSGPPTSADLQLRSLANCLSTTKSWPRFAGELGRAAALRFTLPILLSTRTGSACGRRCIASSMVVAKAHRESRHWVVAQIRIGLSAILGGKNGNCSPNTWPQTSCRGP